MLPVQTYMLPVQTYMLPVLVDHWSQSWGNARERLHWSQSWGNARERLWLWVTTIRVWPKLRLRLHLRLTLRLLLMLMHKTRAGSCFVIRLLSFSVLFNLRVRSTVFPVNCDQGKLRVEGRNRLFLRGQHDHQDHQGYTVAVTAGMTTRATQLLLHDHQGYTVAVT